jgi:ubiquinone/menaquinone biosynthesis C-methylase UbiE
VSRAEQEGASLGAVRRFWESHVNNEYYTRAERGTAAYFDEIERRRYRWHYHLVDLFRELHGSSGKLLEIGCGIGMDSVQLARAGFDVTGVDLTESAIKIARIHARLRAVPIEFATGNAEALGFPNRSFRVVYSFGVLHHTPDIRTALAEVYRVLEPGGTAYIMLYHRNSLVNLIHQVFRLPYESPRNIKDHCPVVDRFTKAEAADLFRGFTDVRLHADYPFTYGFRYLTAWMPHRLQRWLGRRIGWHLMIQATR